MLQVLTEKITSWDTRVCTRIFGWNGKVYIDWLMLLLTRSGDGYLYAPLGILLFLYDYTVAIILVPAAALAFVIELPAQKLIKQTIKRNRPYASVRSIHHLVKPPDKFSFPSGHTAGAFIVAGLVAAFYPIYSIIALTWATGVGISRVYNGVHYPTDVIAGAMLGLLSSYTGLSIIHFIIQ